jgi:hypothetical protein
VLFSCQKQKDKDMTVLPRYNDQALIAPSPGIGEGIGGSVLWAPLGTPLPESTDAVLNSAFTDLGYVDNKGIRNREERKTTDVYAWGGDLVATLQDSYTRTMEVTFLQFLDPEVISMAYGTQNVTVTPPTESTGTEVAAALNSLLLNTVSWVFQGFYQDALVCQVLPIARITSIGEVNWTNTALTTISATIKCFPDSLRNASYLYTNDGINTFGS